MKKLLSALSVSIFSVLLIFNAAGCSTAQPEQIEEPNADFSGSNSDYVQSPDYEEQGQNGNSADYAALYEDTYRSVVTVSVTTDRISPKTGTGVLIESEEGYLLTSSSLFELTVENHTFLETDCSIRLYDGQWCDATLQGFAAQQNFGNTTSSSYIDIKENISFENFDLANSDLALVKIDGVKNGLFYDADGEQKTLPSAAQLADSDTLVYGEDCYTISALAHEEDILSGVMNEGIITKPFNTHSSNFTTLTDTFFQREEEFFDGSFDYLIQTGVTINAGSEGAPLFNAEGKVVGMMNLRVSDTYIYSENDPYGISFATPSDTIYKLTTTAHVNIAFEDENAVRENCIANAGELGRYQENNEIALSLMNRYPDYFVVNSSAPIQFQTIEQNDAGNMAMQTAAAQLDKTVKILAYSSSGLSEGSGFLIDTSGYILTNLHVINSLAEQNQEKGELANATVKLADAVYCIFERGTTSDGKFVVIPMDIIAYNQRGDLAILKINNPVTHINNGGVNGGFAEACSFEQAIPAAGERVVAIGNALGYGVSVATGIVSVPEFESYYSLYGYNMIQTDCPINSGNSGGALFNSAGNVIGINTLGLAVDGYDNVSWAIPASFAVSFIEDVNQGNVSKNVAILMQNVHIDLV